MENLLIPLGLIIFLIIASVRHHWGIYLIILLLPTYQIRFSISTIPTTVLESMLVILALVVLIDVLIKKRVREIWRSLIIKYKWQASFVLLFLIGSIVAVIITPARHNGIGLFKAFIFEPIVFFFIIRTVIDSKEKLQSLMRSFGWLVLYLSLFGIYQFITLKGLPPNWWAVDVSSRRITSLVNHPNALALLIGPPLAAFAVYLLDKLGNLNKHFLLTAAGFFGIIAFYLTFSRAGWAALFLSVLIVGLLTKHKKKVLSAVLILIIIIIAIPETRTKIFPLIKGNDPSRENRTVLWSAATDLLTKSPILGVGLAGFRVENENYPLGPDQVVQNYPHNFFLNFWLETTFFGMLSIVALLIMFYYRIWRLHRQEWVWALPLAAAMSMIVLHGLVDVPYFKNDLAILFWTILALPYLNFKVSTSSLET